MAKVISDLHSFIIEVYNQLLSFGHSLWFQWVPGHVGLHGNARADAATKRARDTGPIADIPLTTSACQLNIRRFCTRGTRVFTEDAAGANVFLRSIDPTMNYVITGHLSQREESVPHRLHLNVARTPSLLFKMHSWSLQPVLFAMLMLTHYIFLLAVNDTGSCAMLSGGA